MTNAPYNEKLWDYSTDDFDGFKAAPLLIVGEDADPDLTARQNKLAMSMVLAAYGEITPVAKRSVAAFVARSIVGRMHLREGSNYIEYVHRENEEPLPELVPYASPEAVFEACELIKYGEGTPCQNDIARRALGMASVELANLTILNDFRKELEPRLWHTIGQLVGHDATPSSDQFYDHKILEFDKLDFFKSQHVGAVRIEMKRKIGTLDDMTNVKARTTAVINTSPSSGFDQSIIAKFREYEEEPHAFEKMAELPEFRHAINWLIDTELTTGLVLARNETVYEDSSLCEQHGR